MEEKQVLDSSINGNDGFVVTQMSRVFLEETRKWAKFFAVLGFIGVGFMIIIGLFFGSFMSKFGNMGDMPVEFPTAIISVIYILMALIMIVPLMYLNKYANFMKTALRSEDSSQLELAFENFKSYYKFQGIMAIIFIGIYALMLLIGIVSAVFTSF
jgi:amino acid transporter